MILLLTGIKLEGKSENISDSGSMSTLHSAIQKLIWRIYWRFNVNGQDLETSSRHNIDCCLIIKLEICDYWCLCSFFGDVIVSVMLVSANSDGMIIVSQMTMIIKIILYAYMHMTRSLVHKSLFYCSMHNIEHNK